MLQVFIIVCLSSAFSNLIMIGRVTVLPFFLTWCCGKRWILTKEIHAGSNCNAFTINSFKISVVCVLVSQTLPSFSLSPWIKRFNLLLYDSRSRASFSKVSILPSIRNLFVLRFYCLFFKFFFKIIKFLF